MLGDPDKLEKEQEAIDKANAKKNFGGKKGGGGGAAFDPLAIFQAMKGGAAVDPSLLMKKAKPHFIGYDDRTNTVFVSGPPEIVTRAKSVVKEMDQPSSSAKPVELPRIEGPPILRTYLVPGGNADQAAKVLQEVFKSSPTLRINNIGNTQIMVYAPPADQIEIARHIEGSTPPNVTTAVVQLDDADATMVATILIEYYGQFDKTGAPYVRPDISRNTVVIMGSPDQIVEVKQAIKALVGETEGVGPGIGEPNKGGNTRAIQLEGKSGAATVAEALQEMFQKLRKNNFIVNDVNKILEPKDKTVEPAKEVPADKKADKEPVKDKQVRLERRDGEFQVVRFDDPQEKKQEEKKPGQQPKEKGLPDVTVTPLGNKLYVTTDDPEAMKLISELLRMLNTPAGIGDFTVLQLKTADAVSVAAVLDAVFNGATSDWRRRWWRQGRRRRCRWSWRSRRFWWRRQRRRQGRRRWKGWRRRRRRWPRRWCRHNWQSQHQCPG